MTFDTAKELELINRYTRKTLTEDDVYRFTLTLCDNEVDRDLERFTPEALQELAALFPGKTGLFDHSCKSEQQSARLFCCWLESDRTRLTSCGEPYTCLKARAYMAESLQLFSLKISPLCHYAVKAGAGVSLGEHESVSVGVLRISGIYVHLFHVEIGVDLSG